MLHPERFVSKASSRRILPNKKLWVEVKCTYFHCFNILLLANSHSLTETALGSTA